MNNVYFYRQNMKYRKANLKKKMLKNIKQNLHIHCPKKGYKKQCDKSTSVITEKLKKQLGIQNIMRTSSWKVFY